MNRLPLVPSYVTTAYVPSRYNHFVPRPDGTTLAYNSYSNALATLEPAAFERYSSLAKGSSIDRSNEVDRMLVQGRYLIPRGLDERAALRQRHLKARYDNASWGLTICPTIQCNFGCDYCFETHRPGKMSQEVQDRLVTLLEERAAGLAAFDVTWYGGEPTLAWDVIQALSARFIAACAPTQVAYSAGVITNGFLLDEAKVRELPSLGIGFVQVTLDGDEKSHDARRHLLSGRSTFARIIENLKAFIGQKTRCSIRVNVDSRNAQAPYALMDQLVAHGLAGHRNIGIYFSPVTSTSEPSHGVASVCLAREKFADEAVGYYEYAAKKQLSSIPFPGRGTASCVAAAPDGYVVQPDGELHKCWDTVGDSQQAVGHLLDPGGNPLESPLYHQWMSWDPFDDKVACSSCSWLPSCMGGCPMKTAMPEIAPEGQRELDCTMFKFNADKLLAMYADQRKS